MRLRARSEQAGIAVKCARIRSLAVTEDRWSQSASAVVEHDVQCFGFLALHGPTGLHWLSYACLLRCSQSQQASCITVREAGRVDRLPEPGPHLPMERSKKSAAPCTVTGPSCRRTTANASSSACATPPITARSTSTTTHSTAGMGLPTLALADEHAGAAGLLIDLHPTGSATRTPTFSDRAPVHVSRNACSFDRSIARLPGPVRMDAGIANVPRSPRKTATGGVGRVKAKTRA